MCFILWESSRISWEILDFCSSVVEVSILLGCGTMTLGDWWQTFWNNIMVSTWSVKKSRTSQPQLLMFWRHSRYALETRWEPVSHRGSIMFQKYYVFNHTGRNSSRLPILCFSSETSHSCCFYFHHGCSGGGSGNGGSGGKTGGSCSGGDGVYGCGSVDIGGVNRHLHEKIFMFAGHISRHQGRIKLKMCSLREHTFCQGFKTH